MSGLFSLEGRRAMVTGASRGLGRAMAVALAEAGADVVCASSQRGGTDETAAAIRAAGRQAWQVEADLADRDAVLAMADDAVSQAGRIDILINNGGTIRRHPAAEYPMEAWDAVLRTNLDSVFLLSQRLGAGMIERGSGKIINIASLLSFSGGITVPAYTASKHAVAGLTRALANEWAKHGVQVNAIAPGYFRTDNTQRLQDDPERSRDISARIPAGRWGESEDMAGAAVFLASRASDYVNGHVLVVDGGWMAR
ncbi:2-dehydro-3-deoxy-D-gluconate 5-dehydrogenase KduD [Longimicrobium terrae]|uniref:2-deoxy-D-gluconate 3-dehydrogenase n=1 Tax=Longimicrobium terrae TaxID=1639882 RepID=A0A841H8E1_9BACT|nr:2-dehydro-3-deoxy-D-gluconate 5-dehydrogenase KduD [Longimicrobium terrae]MBB4639698.1 2-deoxy-D-gluconate 3-dehydrogenase [Longimicrobium terrae]MBB6074096.1 2-deoxy-D-gluconate 3-dehydrogenase [Longimicrobium terrae]NNC28291.1 2-dehydro-3-deoxy-D-gluconate 5-dehydrogenase KduD [Longimicrobium terrae]